MADPFRLRVKKAVSAQLKTINVPGGYCHDLEDFTDSAGRTAERVFRGRDQFGDNDPLPMASVLEDPRALDARNANENETATTGEYKLLIMGFVEDDRENPTDPADVLAADIATALAKGKVEKYNILGLGTKMPCVTKLTVGQPVVRPADGVVADVAFCYIMLTLTLVEDLEKPYD